MATGTTFLACRTAAGQDDNKPSIEKPLEPAAKQVTITFLAGAKKVPLDGLKVTIRKYTGHWTDDQKAKPLAGGKTDKEGTARFTLSDGSYYAAITSETELPYLGIAPSIIKVGKDTAFDFNLVEACKLTLRAVDETGKGIPGVSFMMASETYEYSGEVVGDNLGADHKKQGEEVTDTDGYLTRYMAPHPGYTYFAWPTPNGYDVVPELEAEIPTPLGKASAEHVFKFRRIRFAVRLEPEKKRIKLGEPLTFDFTVTNRIADSRGLQLGGDDRNRLGRPASFEVKVINNDATKMPIPDAGPALDGISSNVLLKPNGETTVKLKLSDWATITQPGSYRVIVKRTLKLFPVKAQDGDRIVWSDAPETEKVEARCEVDVVAADEQSSAEGQGFKSYKQKIHNSDVSFEMVAISGGEFTMGSPDGEAGRSEDEGPQHRVRVQSFWMGKCEVTWDEFELWLLQTRRQEAKRNVTDRSPLDIKADAVTRPTLPYADLSNGMGIRGCPAICISQHAAKKYCEWLSARTGLYYRLPTEAEWEYACRAGTTTAYSFGDDPSLLDEYAWHDGNCEVGGVKKYHPVGLKKPNPWGLHDMHGNVAEWVQDKYEAGFYKALPADQIAESPLCIARLEYPRVTRGGSWMSEPSLVRSAVRQPSTEKWKESDPQAPKSAWYITDAPFIGFRIVRPLRTPSLDERKSQHLDAVVPTDVVERGRTGD
jgi:formylglycine-generating enzyme required for sulfatase activity